MASAIITPISGLCNGDRMDRDEFLRRWELIPELKNAELIDGVVYLPSPVSRNHGRFDSLIALWIGFYAARRGGLEVLSNTTWLMLNSSPQPDIALLREQRRKGTGYPDALPELIVEICHSSRAYDLGPKLDLYRRAGVAEYITVLLEEERVEWRILKSRRYVLLAADAGGLLKSPLQRGLWLDPAALFREDSRALLAALEAGSASV